MADSKDLEQNKKIWTLDTEATDADLIDTNDLLDENDLKKPEPSSLKATGIETKRKACAGCTCGLAEELEEEAKQEREKAQTQIKSSCGNVSKFDLSFNFLIHLIQLINLIFKQCYLGDAFRCGNCPYLGTPGIIIKFYFTHY